MIVVKKKKKKEQPPRVLYCLAVFREWKGEEWLLVSRLFFADRRQRCVVPPVANIQKKKDKGGPPRSS